MFMSKDIYLFEKVIFKDFKDSIVTNIHSHEELWHTVLKIHFLIHWDLLKTINIKYIYEMNKRRMSF